MSVGLRYTALGVMLGWADIGVGESGGNNKGPQVSHILKNCDPPILVPAPWCAATVQLATDIAARAWGTKNPLDAVKLEAYVQSYVDWAKASGRLVQAHHALPGHLVCFSYGGERYDHIGMLQTSVTTTGVFQSVEGNTSDADARDGDGIASNKNHTTKSGKKPPVFIAWTD